MQRGRTSSLGFLFFRLWFRLHLRRGSCWCLLRWHLWFYLQQVSFCSTWIFCVVFRGRCVKKTGAIHKRRFVAWSRRRLLRLCPIGQLCSLRDLIHNRRFGNGAPLVLCRGMKGNRDSVGAQNFLCIRGGILLLHFVSSDGIFFLIFLCNL